MVSTSSNERAARWALIAILLLAGGLRYGLLDIPLERDEGGYAYAGQLILQGIPPFREFYDIKLPTIYAAYALCMAVFGQTHQGLHTALLFINAVTTILVFLLARRLGTLITAVTAAAVFALLSASQSLQGAHANTEHFVILLVAGGLLVVLRGLDRPSLPKFFAAGLLLGLAMLIKQNGAVFVVFAGLYILYDSLWNRPVAWLELAPKLLAFAAGVLAVVSFLFLIMYLAGVFEAFWFWTFEYISIYVSKIPPGQAWTRFIARVTPILLSAPLLWAVAGSGIPALFSKGVSKPARTFLLMYGGFSLLSILPGFYFFPHYFVLLLPCTAILAGTATGVMADYLSGLSSRKIRYGLPLLLIGLPLLHTIFIHRDYFFYMTPLRISRSLYGVNPFQESLGIARFIAQRSDPEDRIAVLGSEPQIYFYSKRRSVSPHVYMYPLMGNHDDSLRMQQDYIRDVEANNPKHLVMVNVSTSWLKKPDSHEELFQWLAEYLKRGKMKLVGVVEILDEETIYHWAPNVKWPVASPNWIAVYERTE